MLINRECTIKYVCFDYGSTHNNNNNFNVKL